MKKQKIFWTALIPVITVFGLYLSFYPRIESKPNHVGFWFIFALGMSVGVLLTRLILLTKEK